MFLCTELSDVVRAIQSIDGPHYISEFVKKKNEYRVFVAQNRVVWMIRKIPKSPDDVTWGCIEDGKFEYMKWGDWNSEVVRVGLASMKLSGLDFGAVDVIEDENGVYVLEINSAPWLSPYYSKCLGKVFKHIVENGKEHLPDPSDLTWQNTIHPAISA